MIDRLRVLILLGSHVVERPHRLPRRCQRDLAVGVHRQARQAEVGQSHVTLLVEQNILRLNVAVDNALSVRERQRLRDLSEDPKRLVWIERLGFNKLAKVHAVHVLHREVVHVFVLAEVVDGNNVRMIEPRHSSGFAGKAFREQIIASEFTGQDLECDYSIELFLSSFEDAAHAAGPEQFQNLQVRELFREFFDGR